MLNGTVYGSTLRPGDTGIGYKYVETAIEVLDSLVYGGLDFLLVA